MNRKYLLGRAIDAAVISMLLLGSGDVRVFATVVAAVMALLALACLLSMTKEAAQVVHGTPQHRVVGWSLNLLYVAALVVSGSPLVAVFYLTAAVCLRFHAEEVVTKAAGV